MSIKYTIYDCPPGDFILTADGWFGVTSAIVRVDACDEMSILRAGPIAAEMALAMRTSPRRRQIVREAPGTTKIFAALECELKAFHRTPILIDGAMGAHRARVYRHGDQFETLRTDLLAFIGEPELLFGLGGRGALVDTADPSKSTAAIMPMGSTVHQALAGFDLDALEALGQEATGGQS